MAPRTVIFFKSLFLSFVLAALGMTIPASQVAAASAKSSQTASKQKKAKQQVKKKNSSKKRVAKRNKTSKKLVVQKVQTPYEDIVLKNTGNLLLKSSAALVFDSEQGDTLYSKNTNEVLPIASITKLMTAMVVLDAGQSLSQTITVSTDDIDYLRGTNSRIPIGTEIVRNHALLLALMSSENRVTHALARNYPGGLPACIAAMNKKAYDLGMKSTRFEDPTGLSSNNVSTAADLAKMVTAAYQYPLIREFSTTSGATVELGERSIEFRNTNSLVKNPDWEIYVSKTGFIREAGRCLVMFAKVADKPVTIVLLDAAGQMARLRDATRIKRWMEVF